MSVKIIGSILISLFAACLAFLHITDRVEVDTTALVLLAAVALPWVFPMIKSLKIGGLEYERFEKMEENVETLLATRSEDSDASEAELSTKSADLTPEQLAALSALKHERYDLRTATGVRKGAGLSDLVETKQCLNELTSRDLARQATGRKGQELWGLTPDGRALLRGSAASASPDG